MRRKLSQLEKRKGRMAERLFLRARRQKGNAPARRSLRPKSGHHDQRQTPLSGKRSWPIKTSQSAFFKKSKILSRLFRSANWYYSGIIASRAKTRGKVTSRSDSPRRKEICVSCTAAEAAKLIKRSLASSTRRPFTS